jgi:hypothetical protein
VINVTRRAAALLVLVAATAVVVKHLGGESIDRLQRWAVSAIGMLNGNWPPWVSNVANIVQIVGVLAGALALVTARIAKRPSR